MTILRVFAATALSGFLLAWAPGALGADPAWKVAKARAERNPTGVQFGFWPNYGLMPQVTADLGRRPIYRSGFGNWSVVEKEKGQYDWGKIFDDYALAHRCGASVFANINVIWSREVSPKNKQAIPDFYPPRITRPETREAAKRFVYAYVQELLRRVGNVFLTFDYEFPYNYRTAKPENRREYRNWYVEACETARRAAADLSMSESLLLLPIVNGNPLGQANQMLGGGDAGRHQPQKWLLDVVAASDGLGIDTYGYDPAHPGSADVMLNTLRFWKDNYAQGKPIYVTENGYSSVLQDDPSYNLPKQHARGTEADQRQYFANAIQGLLEWNRPGGPLDNQVRAFCLWMYRDQETGKDDPLEDHFGLLRMDGSKKPAWQSVQQGFQKAESAEATQPSRVVASEDVTDVLKSGTAPVRLAFSTGTDFEYLHCEASSPAEGQACALTIATRNPGEVLVCVNGKHWIATVDENQDRYRLDVGEFIAPKEKNTFDIYFTGSAFPFVQEAIGVALETR